jgi:hypothetical protein
MRRHWNSGIQYLNPLPEHSGTGLGLLVLVLGWSGIGIFVHSGTGQT